jgi:hypothetical protein
LPHLQDLGQNGSNGGGFDRSRLDGRGIACGGSLILGCVSFWTLGHWFVQISRQTSFSIPTATDFCRKMWKNVQVKPLTCRSVAGLVEKIAEEL